MGDWHLIKRIEDPEGIRRLDIQEGAGTKEGSSAKTYRYQELEWMHAGEEDEGALGDGFWSTVGVSGYFGTAEECETEARQTVPWLGSTDIAT